MTQPHQIELQPRYDSAKSFYKKARYEQQANGITLLWSYTTCVAQIDHDNNIVTVHGTYGATTLRHIKEFLKQFGHTADTKKQIERDYMN